VEGSLPPRDDYDVLIIGCGVSGANIACRLSAYDVKAASLEKAAVMTGAPAFKLFVLLCVLYKPQKALAEKEEQLQYQKR
jgi:succinate dehydrogenase/fumarate reductase flavoprotein subunit